MPCRKVIVCLFTVLFLFTSSVSGSTYLPHTLHSQLTGASALSDSTPYDVYGTDLGIILKHNGIYYYIFGDTLGNGGLNWRSNTMAYSYDSDPSDGISLNGWIASPIAAYAKELISSLKVDFVEKTCIPTAAVSHDGLILIYYMSVRHWGSPGVWECNNASIAVSTNNGQDFFKMANISWLGDSNFVQFGLVQDALNPIDDGYFYLLATPAGRFGACYLCRVPKISLLNQSAYEYYSDSDSFDNPIWSSIHTAAISIFPAPVGELSIMWNAFLNKWTVFYFDTNAYDIVLRTADNLWGPWSAPQAIVGGAEYPTLYGSYIHPDFVENAGEVVYFVMSKFDVYNTFILSVDLGSLNTASSPIKLQTFIAILLTTCTLSLIIKKWKKVKK
ncbi:MAG: DUF4185 domain-containing protein [Asgard group archaeon]|nr:DUF4185 domain-containing protein [Asgard group archaeon]